MTTLADGSVFTIGGSWSGGRGGKDGEVWTSSEGWRVLSNVPDDPFTTDDNSGFYRSGAYWFQIDSN